MGDSPGIVPELLGKLDPDRFPFLGRRSAGEPIRSIEHVWIVTTDGKRTSSVADRLCAWWGASPIIPRGARLVILQVGGTGDLHGGRENEHMDEAILRATLLARERCRRLGVPLYCSLAGGRKTMSATLQYAATVFGADGCFHVHATGDVERLLNDLPRDGMVDGRDVGVWLISLPPPGGIDGLFVDVPGFPGIRSRDFSLLTVSTSRGRAWKRLRVKVDEGRSLRTLIESRVRDASRIGQAFLDATLSGQHGPFFPSLLRLPMAVVKRLKSYRIGTERSAEARELEWLRRLPKAELHCHLGGVLDAEGMLIAADAIAREESRKRRSPLDSVQLSTFVSGFQSEGALLKHVLRFGSGELAGIPRWAVTAAVLRRFEGRAEQLDGALFRRFLDPGTFRGIGIRPYMRLGDLQGSSLLTHPAALEVACGRLVRLCEADGVRYVEVRCSPFNYAGEAQNSREALSLAEDVVRRIDAGMRTGESRGVRCSMILIGTRHSDQHSIERAVALTVRLLRSRDRAPLPAGFDVAGAEGFRSPGELRRLLRPVLEACLPVTIHAGETEPARGIWEAVYELGAERIGHGLTLKDDRPLLTKVRDRGLTLEMCPSSNDQIVGFRDAALGAPRTGGGVYPLSRYLGAGLAVTVNTDNPGISRTTLSQEFLKAARMSPRGLTAWQILSMVKQSFDAAFLPRVERQALAFAADEKVFGLLDEGHVPWN